MSISKIKNHRQKAPVKRVRRKGLSELMGSGHGGAREGAGRPPRYDITPVLVRMPDPKLAKVDAWRAAQPDKPTRPEALRRLAEIALEAVR